MQISSPTPDLLNQELWDGASTLCSSRGSDAHSSLRTIFIQDQWKGWWKKQFRNKGLSDWEVLLQLWIPEPCGLYYATMGSHLLNQEAPHTHDGPTNKFPAIIKSDLTKWERPFSGSQIQNHTTTPNCTSKMHCIGACLSPL